MLSKKSDYALRTLVYLAINNGKVISTKEISKNLSIPYKFLTQILLELSRKDIVNSKRGSKGGIALKKSPSQITLLEVVEAVDGPFYIHQCPAENEEPCFFANNCPIKESLAKIEGSARRVLSSITVDKIFEKYKLEKEGKNENNKGYEY